MQFVQPSFPAVPAIPLTYEQCFLYRRNLKKAFVKQKELDAVPNPSAPNQF